MVLRVLQNCNREIINIIFLFVKIVLILIITSSLALSNSAALLTPLLVLIHSTLPPWKKRNRNIIVKFVLTAQKKSKLLAVGKKIAPLVPIGLVPQKHSKKYNFLRFRHLSISRSPMLLSKHYI